MNPACPVDRLRVSSSVSLSTTALATVISSPSRIHATPRAMTMRVWKGDQGSRSMRAGMRLRMLPGACAAGAVVMDSSWVRRTCDYPAEQKLTHTTRCVARPGDGAAGPPAQHRDRRADDVGGPGRPDESPAARGRPRREPSAGLAREDVDEAAHQHPGGCSGPGGDAT